MRFAQWYFKFLAEPRADCFLYWMDGSFIDEGECDMGSTVKPATAQVKQIVFQESCNLGRIGLLDGLVLFWQQVSTNISKGSEDEQVLEAAAKDPNNWLVARKGDSY